MAKNANLIGTPAIIAKLTKSLGFLTPPHGDAVTGTDLPGDKRGLDVAIGGGSVQPSGLSKKGQHTEITLNSSTWTKLERSGSTNPTGSGPLAERNQINIQNSSTIEFKINYEITDIDVEIPGYRGMPVQGDIERLYGITDAIPVFAKSISGTPTIDVEELA